MKRKLLSLIGIFSLISIFAMWAQPVKANVDYDITDMNVTAKVNRNGSVMIHRKIRVPAKLDSQFLVDDPAD
ncbi:hypothetical protein [Lactobacillus helveticus]|uniref:hypothetical protein n=1 Tax=Lactobacillus helveticus TaxID=1587 RepID=UPI0003B7E729|nr:hypothetical protein [Lactobacillus helveticus]MCT3417659.1 hypothetical protein [Lactobacillus helveticus]NRD35997.1 hypothetical protein [Lactobacillus helveticus]CDI62932.1 Putative uncharacterized protein [Lactobacillus helveticus CIRM-BIA 103]